MDLPLPSGTLTFLFTDIAGSTELWEERPDAMRAAMWRHDTVLRAAIESCSGHIVKTTGDGVYAAFVSAANAIAACLTAQRGLRVGIAGGASPEPDASGSEPSIGLDVRMGLHTGIAEPRDGDYFGATVNRAARIMALASGGQILLSAATAERLLGQLTEGVTLREMGEFRLKGLREPERISQVVVPDLRADFPPLAALTSHSLPGERDVFIGRRQSLMDLAHRLREGARLVSVLGMGGAGKTRLVTRFGWNSLGQFPGGVWFCDLAHARTLDGVSYAVAQGLDLPLGKDDPVTQVGRAIAGRGRCLVILDNFEQVARYAEETLGRWLSRASDARFLVTTREVLGLAGEVVLALTPLAPAEAAELFLRRAEGAHPGFRPNTADRSAIAPLMKMLEGLPLAIELAAARVRVMPPRTLLSRMSERFKLLASASGRVERQATLRAVFDWSWDLLSPSEKAALAQLSVFENGFTLGSVEAILDLSPCESAPWPLDVLQSLVQKSLVRGVTDDRLDLLVSVQEYAAEQLRTATRYPGSGPAALLGAQVRHGEYFAGLDEKAAEDGAELDNFVAACGRAVARADREVAADALDRVWAGLKRRGPFRVGVDLAFSVLSLSGLGAPLFARGHWIAGSALRACGRDREAYDQLVASLARSREVGNRNLACRVLISLGFLDIQAGRREAASNHLGAALAAARELTDRTLESDANDGLGNVALILGRVEDARAHFEVALALARQAGNRLAVGNLLGNVSNLHAEEGNLDDARAFLEEALALAREVGDRALEGNSLCNLGSLHEVQGKFAEALDPLEAALALARELGHARLECLVSCNLGIACDNLGRLGEAREYFRSAVAIARELGDRRSEGQCLSHLGLLCAHLARFDEARSCLEEGANHLMAVSDQMSLGLLRCHRAETEHLAGNPVAANVALAAAAVIGAEVGAGRDSELGLALDRVRELVGCG